MLVNRPVTQSQPPQVLNNLLAIPVGTNNVISYSKFLWDQRDLNCASCKNGMKSMVSKKINEKVYNIPVVCTCVPYVQASEEDGVQIVAYKGRLERWATGKNGKVKRPETYIHDEKVRSTANKAAVDTRGRITGENVINTKKFQFVKVNPSVHIPKTEFLSKSFPNAPISRPTDVPMEMTTKSSLPDNPRVGDVTKKNLSKAVKAPEKHLQTLPNGTKVFLDDKSFAKLSGVKATSKNEPKLKATPTPNGGESVVITAPSEPGKKKRGRPAKSAPQTPAPVVVPQVAVEEPAKKKRGRPRKVELVEA